MHVNCGMGVLNTILRKLKKKIQLQAARIVTGLTTFSSLEALYFETGWETLAERRRQRKLTTFYQMHNTINTIVNHILNL